jgi:chromosome segregation ATPase
MFKNRGNIVEKGVASIKTIIETLSLKAFAEEKKDDDNSDDTKGGEDDSSKSQEPTINYEDLIAKARREEKEKQYKTIENLKTKVNSLTEQHNNDLVNIANLQKKLDEANAKLTTAGKGDSDEVKTLKGEIKTLTDEKTSLEAKVKDFESKKPVDRSEVEAEVQKELEAEYEVKTYKVEQLAEHKDDILVPELVGGDTKEEIDATIKKAIERSDEIKKSLGYDGKKKKSATRTPISNPSVSKVQDNEISLEKLASMDVRSPEYAELRKQLGLH